MAKKKETYLSIDQAFGEFPHGKVIFFKAKDYEEASEILRKEELGQAVLLDKKNIDYLKKKLKKMS